MGCDFCRSCCCRCAVPDFADPRDGLGFTYIRLQTKLRDAETAARDAADKVRKASAYAALWIFISLLMGAFAASLAATIGGQQRDL